jgi:hypothetical protein
MRLTELDVALKLHFADGCICTTGEILQTLTFEVRDYHFFMLIILMAVVKWSTITSFERQV